MKDPFIGRRRGCAGSARRSPGEVEEYAARADASYDAGLYADAVEAWREVYRRDARHPGVVEGLAASRAALEKALSKRKIDELMARAAERYKAADYPGAAELWLDILQIDPTYQSARTWLRLVGKKFKEDPREPAAPSPAPPSPSAKPSAPLPVAPPAGIGNAEELYRRGLIAYSQGDVAGAMEWLKKSLAKDPTLRRAQQALEQCQTETSLTRK